MFRHGRGMQTGIGGAVVLAAIAAPWMGTPAAFAAPRIGGVEAFAAPGGQLLVHTELRRGTTRQPAVVTFTVDGQKVRATREHLDGHEGANYRVDYDALFAPTGGSKVGDNVKVTIKACAAGCTSSTVTVPVERYSDR